MMRAYRMRQIRTERRSQQAGNGLHFLRSLKSDFIHQPTDMAEFFAVIPADIAQTDLRAI